MLKYKILTGARSIKEPCKDASIPEAFSIIDKLDATLGETQGIGLAANQIGIRKRVCILRVPQIENGNTFIFGVNFVNPVITHLEDPIVFENEGCLSFPSLRVKTLRYNKVVVVDSLEPKGREFTGLMAVCAQHECCHTEGKTMYDFLISSFKDETNCPCNSGKRFDVCCKEKVRKYG